MLQLYLKNRECFLLDLDKPLLWFRLCILQKFRIRMCHLDTYLTAHLLHMQRKCHIYIPLETHFHRKYQSLRYTQDYKELKEIDTKIKNIRAIMYLFKCSISFDIHYIITHRHMFHQNTLHHSHI